MFGISRRPKQQPVALPASAGSSAGSPGGAARPGPKIDLVKERVRTFIGSDAIISGDLRVAYGVKVEGGLAGNLTFGTVGGLCIIGENGTVHGNITGPKALILGTVCGDITIEGKLVIGPKAAVMGVVECGLLVVQEGAQLGESLIKVGRSTTKEAARKMEPQEAKPDMSAADVTASVATVRGPGLAVVQAFPGGERQDRPLAHPLAACGS